MPKSIQQFCINSASIFPIAPFGVHSRALQGVFLLALFLIIIKCSRYNVHVTSEQSMLLQKMGQLEDPWSSLPEGALNDRRFQIMAALGGSQLQPKANFSLIKLKRNRAPSHFSSVSLVSLVLTFYLVKIKMILFLPLFSLSQLNFLMHISELPACLHKY